MSCVSKPCTAGSGEVPAVHRAVRVRLEAGGRQAAVAAGASLVAYTSAPRASTTSLLLAAEHARGDQRGDGRRGNGLAFLVDDEASVGIAVEGQPDVGTGLQHKRL